MTPFHVANASSPSPDSLGYRKIPLFQSFAKLETKTEKLLSNLKDGNGNVMFVTKRLFKATSLYPEYLPNSIGKIGVAHSSVVGLGFNGNYCDQCQNLMYVLLPLLNFKSTGKFSESFTDHLADSSHDAACSFRRCLFCNRSVRVRNWVYHCTSQDHFSSVKAHGLEVTIKLFILILGLFR